MSSTKCQVSPRNVCAGYRISDTACRISGRFLPGTPVPGRAFIKIPFFLALFLILLAGNTPVFAQDEPQEQEQDSVAAPKRPVVIQDTIFMEKHVIDPLSPSKAAFYSAILPGLGQVYNKRYWKVPLVYAAIGTGLYFYVTNRDDYHRYRNAYKRRLAGFTDDEFYNLDGSPGKDSPDVSMDALRRAQEYYQSYKDLSLLITIGLYVLNVIDANVDAHLKQHNISEDLTLRPFIIPNGMNIGTTVGLSLSFNF